MLNLIRAELYKVVRNPLFYIITTILCGLIILVELIFKNDPYIGFKVYVIEIICPIVFNITFIFTGIFSLLCFEEYKTSTFKNIISFDISRRKVYLSKFIIEIVVCIIVATICFCIFLLSINLLKDGDGYNVNLLYDLIKRFIACIPLYVGGISIINFLIIIIRNEAIVGSIYVILLILPQKIEDFLIQNVSNKFEFISNLSIYENLVMLTKPYASKTSIIHAFIIGIITTVFFTMLGIIFFQKVEIR